MALALVSLHNSVIGRLGNNFNARFLVECLFKEKAAAWEGGGPIMARIFHTAGATYRNSSYTKISLLFLSSGKMPLGTRNK